jgi:hypothetical protein
MRKNRFTADQIISMLKKPENASKSLAFPALI